MTKRELQDQINELRTDLAHLGGRVMVLEQWRHRAERHLKHLDRETHAPVRPEQWRHIENVTTPHTNSTGCMCNFCRRGL